jgi:predicted DsbA family dithiol-disulfide isomerase
MRIDVIIDSVCPWCFIGKRRLEQTIALRPHLKADIRWHPFLLNPEMPSGGADRTMHLIKKFGSEQRVSRIYGAIADAGLSVEIDFAFDMIRRTPNSVDSHRVIALAQEQGLGTEMVESLFSAYFKHGEDIGDHRVLIGLAENCGIDRRLTEALLLSDDGISAIYDENSHTHRFGINGVPAYIFNDNWVISGAQEPQVLARMFDAAAVSDNAA